MALKNFMEVSRLKKEITKLQEENKKLKEAQKRCTECENFDKRRGFKEETVN